MCVCACMHGMTTYVQVCGRSMAGMHMDIIRLSPEWATPQNNKLLCTLHITKQLFLEMT